MADPMERFGDAANRCINMPPYTDSEAVKRVAEAIAHHVDAALKARDAEWANAIAHEDDPWQPRTPSEVVEFLKREEAIYDGMAKARADAALEAAAVKQDQNAAASAAGTWTRRAFERAAENIRAGIGAKLTVEKERK